MANRREFRSKKFLELLAKRQSPAGDGRVVHHVSGLDETLYVADRVVLGPPVAGQRSGPADRAILEELHGRLSERGEPLRSRTPTPEQVEVFQLRQGSTLDVLAELTREERYRGYLSPQYVMLTHQRVMPGEDPEAGASVAAPPAGREHLGRGVHIVVIDTGISREADPSGALLPPPSPAEEPEDLVHDPALPAATIDDLVARLPPPVRAAFGKRRPRVLGTAAGHGTFIAGLLHQLVPGAQITVRRAFDAMGTCDELSLATAVSAVARLEPTPDVLVLSCGMHGIPDPFDAGAFLPPLLLGNALREVQRALPAMAIVASAGNNESSDPMFPAALPGVWGVAALDTRGRRWAHSNYDTPRARWIPFCTLGEGVEGIFVTGLENGDLDPDGHGEGWPKSPCFARWSGTSFSAPIVAAQIAILSAAAADSGTPLSGEQAARVLHAASPAGPEGCGRRVSAGLPVP